MAALVPPPPPPPPAFDLSADGTRELLTEERTREVLRPYCGGDFDLGAATSACLSNKSFDEASAAVLAEAALAAMPSLTRLDMSDIIAGRETSIGLAVLATVGDAVAKSGAPLRELLCNDNALGPRGIEAMRSLLTTVKSLARYEFCNDGLSSESMEMIRDILLFRGADTETRLEKLAFWNNMSGDGGARALADVVRLSPSLEVVRMSSTRCGMDGGAVLLAALDETCRKLTSLDLSDNTFNEACAPQLGSVVSHNPGLLSLNLSDLNIENDGVAAVLLALSQAPGTLPLEELDMSFSGIVGHECLANLVPACKNAPNLRKLWLEESEIGSRGAMMVARAAEVGGGKLRDVNLKMCCIKRRGAVALALALCGGAAAGPAATVQLDVNGNEISEAGLAELQEIFSAREETTLGSFSDNEEDCDDEEEFDEADIANDVQQEGGIGGGVGGGRVGGEVDALAGAMAGMGV
jgi:Ran GTPase-activating protein 1